MITDCGNELDDSIIKKEESSYIYRIDDENLNNSDLKTHINTVTVQYNTALQMFSM